MRLVRAELAAVAEDSAAAGGNESFGIFLLAAARKPGPRRAWPGVRRVRCAWTSVRPPRAVSWPSGAARAAASRRGRRRVPERSRA